MAHDVFISYASENTDVAIAVCHFLEERGIRAWFAQRDILPGLEWSTAIVDAVSASVIFVLVFSSESNKSVQVKREVELAVSREIIIIPFRIEDIPLSKSLEYFVGPHHWLDALTPPLEKHIQTLVDKVELLLGRASESVGCQEAGEAANPLLMEVQRLAGKWVKAGYAYYILEGISGELKAMLRNPPHETFAVNDNEAALLLMTSIHFGGNWLHWLGQCKDKQRAAKLLFETLDNSYVRPCFRSLCALQTCEKNEIEKLINEKGSRFDDTMHTLLERYVLTSNVQDYLRKIKKGNDLNLSQKASEILREWERYGKKVGNANVGSDLPNI